MALDRQREFTFRCPGCGDSLAVNGAMKRALIEKGCVLCTAELTDRAFVDAE